MGGEGEERRGWSGHFCYEGWRVRERWKWKWKEGGK